MTSTQASADALTRIDSDHLWHPFTPLRWWRETETPIIERAEGFRLIDTEGRSYIDGNASLWCNVHGHRVPELDESIREQLAKVAHSTMLGLSNVPAIELAGRLVAIAPGEMKTEKTKVFYSDAGAAAVEVAMKIARGHHFYRGETQREIFVGIKGAYHGDTSGSMSIGYDEQIHRPFRPLTFACEWSRSPAPCVSPERSSVPGWPSWDDALRQSCLEDAIEDLERTLGRMGDRCAGVVIEPLIQGAAGIVEHPAGFLTAASELARSHGTLLIADEVAVGFGRTGEMFACDDEGVTPDILCLGKGISGGYLPLAATLVREGIAASFDGDDNEYRTLFHGHTYTGNPLACSVALRSLDLFERNDVLANARSIGGLIRSTLEHELADHPNIGDVRGRGVMVGIELVRSRVPHERFERSARVGMRVSELARDRGAIVRPIGDVLILNPAPAMDPQTARDLVDSTIGAILAFDFGSV